MAEKVYLFAKTYDDNPNTDRVFAAGPYPWRVVDTSLQARIDALGSDQVTELTALRDIPGQLQTLTALIETGGLAYATKSEMDANSGEDDDTIALVFDDSTASNNGLYSSNSGSWSKTTLQIASQNDIEDHVSDQRGSANGLAQLDSDTKLPLSIFQEPFLRASSMFEEEPYFMRAFTDDIWSSGDTIEDLGDLNPARFAQSNPDSFEYAIRVSGGGSSATLAKRCRYLIGTAEAYDIKARFKRATDVTSGSDDVVLKLAIIAETGAVVNTVTAQTWDSPTNADGWYEATYRVGRLAVGGSLDVTIPEGVIAAGGGYFQPYLEVQGADGATDVSIFDVRRVNLRLQDAIEAVDAAKSDLGHTHTVTEVRGLPSSPGYAALAACARIIGYDALDDHSYSYQSGEKAELKRLRKTFLSTATGRVGYDVIGTNDTVFSNDGDCASLGNGTPAQDRLQRRAGEPYVRLFREQSDGSWIGYEFPSGGDGTNFLSCYGHFKFMIPVRVDDDDVDNGSGGAVSLPQTSGNPTIRFTTPANTTRLGAIVGFASDLSGICKVTISGASQGSVTPNLLPTAQQAVDRGQCASGVLTGNGGSLATTDRVFGASAEDRRRANISNGTHVPIHDDPDNPDTYTVTITFTGEEGRQQNAATTADRAYVGWFTYGNDGLTPSDAEAELMLMRALLNENDSSSNEELTINASIGGGGYTLMGGGHGNAEDTAAALYLDGAEQVIAPTIATLSKSGGVATVVTDEPHGMVTGERATISAVPSGEGEYNLEGVEITRLSGTSFSYVFDTSGDQGAFSPSAGRVFPHALRLGSQVKYDRTTQFDHPSQTNLATATISAAVDGYGLLIDRSAEFNATATLNNQTFLHLTSTSAGDSSTYGPEYLGYSTWRRLGGPAGTQLDTNDGSRALEGEYLGHTAYWSDLDLAVAWQAEDSSVLPDWASSTSAPHVQDRSDGQARSNVGVDKVYWPLRKTPNTAIVNDGDVISARTRVFHSIGFDLSADPLFAT